MVAPQVVSRRDLGAVVRGAVVSVFPGKAAEFDVAKAMNWMWCQRQGSNLP